MINGQIGGDMNYSAVKINRKKSVIIYSRLISSKLHLPIDQNVNVTNNIAASLLKFMREKKSC